MNSHIISAQKIKDGSGSLKDTDELIGRLRKDNKRELYLTIDPLKTDWNSPLEKNHFRSGCAPVEAIITANDQIISNNFDYAVIHGRDYIKTEYSREYRGEKMNIYGKSIPSLYNELAEAFIMKNKINRDDFLKISELLFENYLKTSGLKKPDKKWFEFITDLFRGVDCANPSVDFEGKLVITNQNLKEELKRDSLRIIGTGFGKIEDGMKNIKNISGFQHLKNAFAAAVKESSIDFIDEFKNNNALMDVYTCYPIIPLAFLLTSGFCKNLNEIYDFLKRYEITVKGGMNLSKAPWNNPTLNAIADLFTLIKKKNMKYGLIHGNGGLAHKQGVLILEAG